jgi:sigma-E factor negative regulatory protein RseB
MRALLSPKFLACLLAIVVLPAWAGSDDPREWIARMNETLASRNYDGVFVHQLGGRRETLRIIHRVRDGRMTERLISTDGSGREFIRKGAEWVAYFPDRKVVVVERRGSPGFITGLHGFDKQSEAQYEIREVQVSRKQGKPVRLITLTPRDQLRYGYRLWIDEATAMPMTTQLTSGNTIIEEIAFISVSLPSKIDDELLQPEVDTTGFRWLRRDGPDQTRLPQVRLEPRADLLPPGFRLWQPRAGEESADKPRARLMVTDGLAWVSVFIEAARPEPARQGRGGGGGAGAGAQRRGGDGAAQQMGASAAYTASVAGHRVTAVGEVPPATVKAIAESIQPE